MNRKENEKKVKLSRIARIDNEISTGKYPNAKKLAEKMEVTERTILRDIDYMRYEFDAPIEYDFYKKGFYYTEPNFFIKSVMLSQDEIEAITIYDNFLKMSSNDKMDKTLRKAIGKVLAVIPEKHTKDLPFNPTEENQWDFHFEPTVVYSGDISLELQNAIKNKDIIEIDYWISDNRKYSSVNIEPLYLFFERHHYYLLAWKKGDRKKPGIYSINRIKKINRTGKKFKLPKDFNISDYIKNTKDDTVPADNKIYIFELSFPKEIADEAIEKTYHHNQSIELRKDGTVFVSFRSTQLYEVFHWVLGQGHKVKVINPPELVDLLKREIRLISQCYSEEKGFQ